MTEDDQLISEQEDIVCSSCLRSDRVVRSEGGNFDPFEVDPMGVHDDFGDWHPGETEEEYWDHED